MQKLILYIIIIIVVIIVLWLLLTYLPPYLKKLFCPYKKLENTTIHGYSVTTLIKVVDGWGVYSTNMTNADYVVHCIKTGYTGSCWLVDLDTCVNNYISQEGACQ